MELLELALGLLILLCLLLGMGLWIAMSLAFVGWVAVPGQRLLGGDR